MSLVCLYSAVYWWNYGLGDQGSIPGRCQDVSSSLPRPDGLWKSVSHPKGIGDYTPRIKRPGRESHHLQPNNAEVKNARIYTSTPPYEGVTKSFQTDNEINNNNKHSLRRITKGYGGRTH
jgi:hypothetical protein